MSLFDQMRLSQQPDFQGRVAGSAVSAALTVQSEVVVEQQTLTIGGTATGGTFTLTFQGQVSAAIQWNGTAIAVQTALNALTTIGATGVECTGGPFPGTPVVVNFNGANLSGPQTLLTATNSLTGTSPTITPTRTTTGTWVLNHAKRAALASKVLANPNSYGQLMAMGVANNATVTNDFQQSSYSPLNGVITNTTGNGVNPIVITSANHGLLTAQLVDISGVTGNTAANVKAQSITKIDANTFSIAVAGNGAYAGGGTWVLSEVQIGSDIQTQMNTIFSSYA